MSHIKLRRKRGSEKCQKYHVYYLNIYWYRNGLERCSRNWIVSFFVVNFFFCDWTMQDIFLHLLSLLLNLNSKHHFLSKWNTSTDVDLSLFHPSLSLSHTHTHTHLRVHAHAHAHTHTHTRTRTRTHTHTHTHIHIHSLTLRQGCKVKKILRPNLDISSFKRGQILKNEKGRIKAKFSSKIC